MGVLAVSGLVYLSRVTLPIPGASDYKTELPNRYFLLREHAGSSLIFQDRDGDHCWDPVTQGVGPSEYGILMAVVGRYIIGNLDTEEKAWGVPEVPDRYFIIDIQSDTIAKELSFQEYEKRMRELGFKDLPELIRPNKLTRFLPE
jgi:hypothetical protein